MIRQLFVLLLTVIASIGVSIVFAALFLAHFHGELNIAIVEVRESIWIMGPVGLMIGLAIVLLKWMA